MADQRDLFSLRALPAEVTPLQVVEQHREAIEDARKRTPAERAAEFHQANPHVMAAIVQRARAHVARGHKTLRIAMYFEVLRAAHMDTTTNPGDDFGLNNSFRAWYARQIMQLHPDLFGLFELRTLTSEVD